MKISSYQTYQFTQINKKTNNEIKKADNKIDNKVDNQTHDKKVAEVLGYGVDKDGFFTSDFNKAAGIPDNFKIHSDTMLSLVNKNDQANPPIYKMRKNIDIAKSAGNAYKVLQGVLGDEFLNSKEFFASDELWNTSHFFEMDKKSLTITNTFDNLEDYQDYESKTNYCRLDSKYRASNYLSGLFAQNDIFHKVEPAKDNYDAWLDSICSFIYDPHKENYQNDKGEYSKGGLLAAVLYNNYILVDGEKTSYAKQMGDDWSDPFDPHRIDEYWLNIMPHNTKRYEIGKEDEWQKLMQKLAYEMISGKSLKAPKDIDSYETFEEFLQAALRYSQKDIKLLDIKV